MSRERVPGDGPKCMSCGRPAVWGGYCQMEDGRGYCNARPPEVSERASAPAIDRAAEAPSLRCAVTGNPCGTDTWQAGHDCPCASCQTWLALRRAGRAVEAPRILGVEMAWNGMLWWLRFGPITATISQSSAEDFLYSVAHNTDWTHSIPDCVAAIERELLAIRDAIPARMTQAEAALGPAPMVRP